MPAPTFEISYRDYLANVPQGSEAGSPPMSESDFNALSPDQKAQLVNFQHLGITVGANDQRYAAFAGTNIKPEDGRPINFNYGTFDPNKNYDSKGNQIIKDPSRVLQGNGWWASSADNETPGYQAGVADSGLFKGDKWDAAKVAAFFAAGIAAAGGLGAAAEGVGAPGMSTAVGGGYGTGALGAGGTGAAFDGASVLDALSGTGASVPGEMEGYPDPVTGEPQYPGEMEGYPSGPEGEMEGYPGEPPQGPEVPGEMEGYPGEPPQGPNVPGEMEGYPDEQSWLDRITNGLPGLMDRLPGIASALARGLGSGQHPGGGGGGGGAAGGGGGGNTGALLGSRGVRPDILENPYSKGKLTPVNSLMQYLRG
jgi:hypothetical protein